MKTQPMQFLTLVSLSGALWLASGALAADPKPERRPPGAGGDADAASSRETVQKLADETGLRERMQKLATELKLSDNQKAEVRSILQEQVEKLREMRGDRKAGQEPQIEKFREWREATNKKIQAVLDKEQQEKWAGLRESFLPGPGGRGGDGAPGAERGEMMRRLGEELQFTEEQKQKLAPIFREEGEKMRALQANDKLSREEKVAKFRELRETVGAKVKAILTPEQQAKWDKLRPGLLGGRDAAGGGGATAAREAMQRMAEELKLTEDQREKLRPIFVEEFGKLRELRENADLPQEDRVRKYQKLREETAAKVKPLLTPEQQAKWEKLRENLGPRRRPN